MIVDDSEESRLLMKNFLLAHNYNVVSEVSDGIEAIKKYYSEKPQLIFLDLAMPKLDGLCVLKKFDFKIPPLKL
jgi:CheY-like chemotaxis protein